MRTDLLHIFNDAFRDSDRAQGHKETAWPLCFLADHAMFERNAFIQMASLKPSGSKTRQDCIAVQQTFSPLRSSRDRQIQPSSMRQLLSQRLHDMQMFFMQIDQHDLRAMKIFSLLNK